MVVRWQVLSGKRVSFIPGWDCHGLPIEIRALEARRGRIDKVWVYAKSNGGGREY